MAPDNKEEKSDGMIENLKNISKKRVEKLPKEGISGKFRDTLLKWLGETTTQEARKQPTTPETTEEEETGPFQTSGVQEIYQEADQKDKKRPLPGRELGRLEKISHNVENWFEENVLKKEKKTKNTARLEIKVPQSPEKSASTDKTLQKINTQIGIKLNISEAIERSLREDLENLHIVTRKILNYIDKKAQRIPFQEESAENIATSSKAAKIIMDFEKIYAENPLSEKSKNTIKLDIIDLLSETLRINNEIQKKIKDQDILSSPGQISDTQESLRVVMGEREIHDQNLERILMNDFTEAALLAKTEEVKIPLEKLVKNLQRATLKYILGLCRFSLRLQEESQARSGNQEERYKQEGLENLAYKTTAAYIAKSMLIYEKINKAKK